jgi:hypothetical protein
VSFTGNFSLLGAWNIANSRFQQIEASFTIWMEPLAAPIQQAENLIVAVKCQCR